MNKRTLPTAIAGLAVTLLALTACSSPSTSSSASASPSASVDTGCVVLQESNLVVLPGIAEAVADIASNPAEAADRLTALAGNVEDAQKQATNEKVKSYLGGQADRLNALATSVRTLPATSDKSKIAAAVAAYATDWVTNYRTLCKG